MFFMSVLYVLIHNLEKTMETLIRVIPFLFAGVAIFALAKEHLNRGETSPNIKKILVKIFCVTLLVELVLIHLVIMDKTKLFDPKVELHSEEKLHGTAVTTSINIGKSKSVTISLPKIGLATFGYEQLCGPFMSDSVGASYEVDYTIKWYKYTYPSGKIKYKRFFHVNHPYGCGFKK